MDIYRASDGAHDTSPLHPADFPSLSHLRKAISNLVDIPLDNLILFLEEGGISLDEKVFERLWEEGGIAGRDGEGKNAAGAAAGSTADDQNAVAGPSKPTSRLSITGPQDILESQNRHPIGIFAFDQVSFQIEDVHAFVAGLEDSLVLCDISGTLQTQDLSISRSRNAFNPLTGETERDHPFIPESGLPIHPVLELDPLLPFQENLSQILHLRERMTNQLRALEIAGGSLEDVWAGLMGAKGGETTEEGEGIDVESDDGSEGSQGGRGRKTRSSLTKASGLRGTQPSAKSGAQSTVSLRAGRTPASPSSWPAYEHLISIELAREESLVARSTPSSSTNQTDAISPGTELPPSAPLGGAQLWGMEQDMQVIRAIPIHESFLLKRGKGREKEREKDKEKVEKRKMLGDYVNAGKMSTVRDSCQRMYDDHLSRFEAIRTTISYLTSSISEIAHSSVRLTEDAHNEAANIVDTVERLVEEASRIALEDPEVHWQSLRGLDGAVRQQVVHMTDLKNDVNLQLHIHLQQISLEQSKISELPSAMSSLEETLRTTRTVHKTGFPHLERLRNMARAYGQTCVEVVWRKEMSQLLLDGAGHLAEGVAGFLTEETARRGDFSKRVLELLPPFEAEALGKSELFSVSFDLSVRSGLDDPQDWLITVDDIAELCALLGDLKRDVSMTQKPLHGDGNPLHEAIDWIREAESQKDRSIADLRQRLSISEPDAPLQEDERDLALVQIQTRLDEVVAAAESERTLLKQDLDDERQESERLRLELEDKEAAELSRLEVADSHERTIQGLRGDLALRIAGEHIAQAQLVETRAQLAALQEAREEELARISNLQAERSQILQGLSDARKDEEEVAARVITLQAELDNALAAAEEARMERDDALKRSFVQGDNMDNASEELERALQDRRDLEAKVALLTTAQEEVRSAHAQALATAKRSAERELDSLNAELGFSRAHLREEKRKLAKLEQEAQQSQAASKGQAAKSTALASRGLRVASQYHDCIARLQSAIQSSATISGSISGSVLAVDEKPAMGFTTAMAQHGFHPGSGDLDLLEKELASLESEDLQPFSEAVSRTMGLVKKWQKSAKQYRDRAKNAIAFSNFAKGDLALFLPTRNATTKPWAAFNISSPHNFLKAEGEVAEQIKTREWLVARITRIEEAVAQSDRPETNPYGLADGIRYQLLYVEPYVPGVPGLKRRNTDAQRPQMPHPPSTTTIPQAISSSSLPDPVKGPSSQRVSHARTASQAEADSQEIAGNPFEGPTRSNVSPSSPPHRSAESVPTTELPPFALRPRTDGPSATRRPSSIASSSGSFGRPRKSVGAIGKAAATAGVVTTTDGQGVGTSSIPIPMGGRIVTGQMEQRASMEGRDSPIGRRDSVASSKASGTATEALRKLRTDSSG